MYSSLIPDKPLLMPIKAHLYAALSSFPLVFIPECLIFYLILICLSYLLFWKSRAEKKEVMENCHFFQFHFEQYVSTIWSQIFRDKQSPYQRPADEVNINPMMTVQLSANLAPCCKMHLSDTLTHTLATAGYTRLLCFDVHGLCNSAPKINARAVCHSRDTYSNESPCQSPKNIRHIREMRQRERRDPNDNCGGMYIYMQKSLCVYGHSLIPKNLLT